MIRNNLAKLMIDRGITATKLFNDTGIARSTISKISNNNTDKISLQTIDKLCYVLGVSPEDFFDYIPYEVTVNVGFENYDSLSELENDNSIPISDWEEPIFLFVNVFHHGKKYSIEYQGTCLFSSEAFFKCSNININILHDEDNTSDIIYSWPVQFQNDFVSIVRERVQNYFDADPTDVDKNIILETLLGPIF
ncbi:helix-turn-helix transcriptional regulator [Streptococcus suis]|uniref:helix-turn-helix domain-containing protein n=2 Tax=Streptococcus suis TaxID=1307 RepID=UPI000CF47F5C|nr:helix-turn-helix transcriptional regulator [Streptococcus suis]MBS8071686.1 helix-turn-helix transcriptional regulator [Streptococcus suis]MBS8095141.1 helix-turn-helix transcriptional regulator [Streptococcus suis]MBS8104011.1 helix-turn-helix transcriptional regulator [Streptococcus suis]MBY4978341.1 helix-turn-helix transcriptional regulator [Streptococcus suis]